MRDFNQWFKTFKKSIATYNYYINFEKVYAGVEKYKIELNILNSLIGSPNIEEDFEALVERYPETLKCIPLLLAVRQPKILAMDAEGRFEYNFVEPNYSIEQYKVFMRKTGLFDLLSKHLTNNLVDYALGVETGLDSHGRKNRGGHLMEALVREYLIDANVEYYEEMYLREVEAKWKIDLSALSNAGKTSIRFDFVVKTENNIYAIETNFYSSAGSKLNETARSYKMLATEAKDIPGFIFVWITDGTSWRSAKGNLEETFDVLETLYNINDLENGIFKELFK